MIDSYLCEELAVETNHAMLRHAEHCGPCRTEMTARRELRARLRRVCSLDRMSAEATDRLRERLRCEAQSSSKRASKRAGKRAGEGASEGRGRRGKLVRIFAARPGLSLAAAAALLLGAAAVWFFPTSKMGGGEVSPALLAAAAGDHRTCGMLHAADVGVVRMPESAGSIDPGYVGLETVAAPGAGSMRLRAAHVCNFGERRFAHLVYTRDDRVVSLLVTGRDAAAVAPPPGIQQAPWDGFHVGACQTGKRVVLVVSDLSERENSALAAQLALPVAEHLRGLEARASMNRDKPDGMYALIAGVAAGAAWK
ncbi:MAG: hypothetical protein ACKVX9_22455 [Blastocatellia bacterium]